jgi:DNA-binding transcriptional regulator YhcF (GntR family)
MKYILTTNKDIYEVCCGSTALRHKKGTKVSISEKSFNELKEKGTIELLSGFREYVSTAKYELSDFESEVTIEKQINQKIKLY